MHQGHTNSALNESQHKKPCGIHRKNVRATWGLHSALVQILQERLRHHAVADKNFGITQPERLAKVPCSPREGELCTTCRLWAACELREATIFPRDALRQSALCQQVQSGTSLIFFVAPALWHASGPGHRRQTRSSWAAHFGWARWSSTTLLPSW
jgi:hypothetical protein